jgi:Tol biopolymer transport system component
MSRLFTRRELLVGLGLLAACGHTDKLRQSELYLHSRLAFTSDRECRSLRKQVDVLQPTLFTSGCFDIYMMRMDGDDVRKVASGNAYALAWSLDGRHIAYLDADEHQGISNLMLVNVNTRERVRLGPVDDATKPVFSPDGNYIACNMTEIGTNQNDRFKNLGIINVRTLEVRRLYGGGRTQQWSPDGTRIALYNDDSGGPRIEVIDTLTGKLVHSCRSNRNHKTELPHWIDNEHLFVRYGDSFCSWPIAGTSLTEIINIPQMGDVSVIVSPNHAQMAYWNHHYMGGAPDISKLVVVDLQSRVTTELSEERTRGSPIPSTSWSPDSRYLAYSVVDAWNHHESRIVDTNGSIVAMPSSEENNVINICWSPLLK